MLTGTSELAIKALIWLALAGGEHPVSPRAIAQRLRCSPSSLAKVMGRLVRHGLLRSHPGPGGGMALALPPEEISLRAIVEATEGSLVGNYCRILDDTSGTACAFHQAMSEVREATVQALAAWTLADLAAPQRRAGREPRMSDECVPPRTRDGRGWLGWAGAAEFAL